MKGRSVNPTPSQKLYMSWIFRYREYQRVAKLEGKVKLSFKQWLYNNNIDISGKTLVHNPFLYE